MITCPCGSNKLFTQCCDRYLNQGQHAPTPEALMRSRYTAFTMANVDYIANTMCGKAAENFDTNDTLHFAKSATWNGLIVHKCNQSSQTIGFVQFTAQYSDIYAQQHRMSEISEFHKINQRWFYVDGKQID
ncbi:MAG: preprotein translocase subunit SecA [Legionellales bacterium]|nr:preprotein translocase subunit SecA [Legionellales bacterium]|tara:strand:+ start:106 stop:498 length:393 start_codon:yes stop_codon:yes gene_type:complete